MDTLDKAKDVRQGEELDAKKIEPFLKDSIPGLKGPVTVGQFPSGHSNLTYLITVGDTGLVLRRPPFGTKAKTAHDMGREFKILSALSPHFPCPKPLAYTEDESIIGAPFYVMERIEGIILRKDPPKELAFTPEMAKKLCENLIDLHVKLHGLDYKALGLKNFGKPEGYITRQVEGWSKRYRAARTPDAPDFEEAMQWLAGRIPQGVTRAAIIHGDYKFDNVVLDPNDPLKIIGVLDWEMATVGDPLMDLGSSLGYWVQGDDPAELEAMRMMPTNMPGCLTRGELVARYEALSGLKVDDWPFYFCFGLFRLAVIAQQIYYRYHKGETKDERFARLIFAVHILDQVCTQVLRDA